jgi:hypothetical protein
MNTREISKWQFGNKTAQRHEHSDHTHFWPHTISRRQFARTAAGAAVTGAAFASGLFKPALAVTHGSGEPLPLPGGSPVLGGGFHVFGPAVFDPIDAEPATITDLNGFVGLTYISGMVTQTNTKTGEERTLPFVDSDMRFMKGVFKGTDGRVHQGAFALV